MFSEQIASTPTTCVRDMYLIRLLICLGMSRSAEYVVYSRYVDVALEPVTTIMPTSIITNALEQSDYISI